MEFHVERDVLLRSLTHIQGVVEKKNSNASEEHLPTVNFQPAFSPSPMVNKRNDIEQYHMKGDVIG